jgi:hypothetical protein
LAKQRICRDPRHNLIGEKVVGKIPSNTGAAPTKPNPKFRAAATKAAKSAKPSRSATDIAHWLITVIGFNVNFDAPLSTVRGGNVNFGLAQECNQFPNFAADRLNLQKGDVSTASTVGQFYQDIVKKYQANGWTVN